MKIHYAFFALIVLALFSACGLAPSAAGPTATAASVLPGGSDATVMPNLTETASPTSTPIPTHTETPTVTSTPTVTATITPFPTRKSPYPVGPGTPLPDLGFPEIGVETLDKLKPVFRIIDQDIWQSAASRDGKELFAATSNGLAVYDRQGKQVAYWPDIIAYDLPCGSCLSVNRDGSRFVLATRKDGGWEAQVYNVDGEDAALLFQQPIDAAFQGAANEVRIALSPEGLLLAYGGGDGDTVVIDLSSLKQVFSYQGKTDALVFTPDGVSFAVRRGREMLFWKTAAWKNPANLLLPADDTPYAFSPDGKFVAIAVFAKVRVYKLDTLAPSREITVLPTSALNRVSQLTFVAEKNLRGYGVRWDGSHTKATVDMAEWDMEPGKTLKMETTETDSPDALSALWGAAIPATSARGDVEIGQYKRFTFVTQDSFLVAGIHTACWLKLSTGEKTCFNDPKNNVLASDTGAYREILQDHNTLLQNWNGGNVFDVRLSRLMAVNKNADYIIINVDNATTDVYFKAKRSPGESVPGILRAFAEYGNQMAIAAGKAGMVYVLLVDRDSMDTLYRKHDRLFLKPMAIDNKSSVYLLQREPDRPEGTLEVIAAPDYKLADVGRLSMSAEPQVMAVAAATGVFAFGLQDGSVLVVSPDGQQSAAFQAAYSPVGGLAFTPDGRYLAVGSTEGIKIFALLP